MRHTNRTVGFGVGGGIMDDGMEHNFITRDLKQNQWLVL